jgi:phosphoglycolate phosphatase
LHTVLFDLDGTLADTAPDLAYALNAVLKEEGRPALAGALIRPFVSQGTRGLLKIGFDITPEHGAFERLRQRLIEIYRHHITRATRLFPGMEELLDILERRGIKWGVVTNKPAALTEPLMENLGFTQRAACIVSGDTTAHAKPHPEPLLHACRCTDSQAHQCLYVGDAHCDIEAGKRAGMHALVALFGYLAPHDEPHTWGADGMVAQPLEILDWIEAYETRTQQTVVT